MTTTDRRDATDAQFADELARLDRLDVADESAVERVARALYESDRDPSEFWAVKWELAYGLSDDYRRRARAAIAALKPAPGTDTSGQAVHGDHGPARCVSVDEANRVLAETRGSTEDALHRVLDLADEYDANFNWREWGVGNRIRAAVAGPQRDHDEEGGQ